MDLSPTNPVARRLQAGADFRALARAVLTLAACVLAGGPVLADPPTRDPLPPSTWEEHHGTTKKQEETLRGSLEPDGAPPAEEAPAAGFSLREDEPLADPLAWVLPTEPTAVSPLSGGTPQFAKFPPELFGGAHNFDGVAQTEDGRVFVIAEHRLMSGTGERWEPVQGMPEDNAQRLHLTVDGRLYVSFENDFGYLDLRESNEPQWRSIADDLPSGWAYGDQWRPLYEDARGYVFFVGGQNVFAHHPEKTLRLWKDVGKVEHIFSLNGVVEAMTADREVYKLEDNGRTEIAVRDLPPTFADIRASIPFSPQRQLFACGSAGLATFDGRRFWSLPLKGIDETHFVPDQLLRIGPELFLALDYSHGLLVFRPDGTVLRQVFQFGDLKARIAQAVTIDRDGWIWLAHASGLYRINAASPQTTFDYHHGLEGRVLDMVEHEGRFYVGTEDGLFVWSQPSPEVAGRFDPIESIPPTYSLISTPDGLAVGSTRGLWVIDGRGPYLVQAGDHRLILQRPEDPTHLYAPTVEGIHTFVFRSQRWIPDPQAPHLPTTGRAALIDPDGALWAEYGAGRIAHYNFQANLPEPTIHTPQQGLPLSTIEPISVGPEMIFQGGKELFRFIPERTLFTHTEGWEILQHAIGGNPAARAVESPNHELWVAPSALGRTYARFPPDGFEYAWPEIQRFGHDPITALYIDSIGYLWVGNGRGLLRFRPHPAPPRKAFARQTLVHRILSVDYDEPIAEFPAGVANLSLGAFPGPQRELRFEFSLLEFDHPGGTTYASFLEGFDGDWQPFQTEPCRTFTALPPGHYTLQLKGRNRFGEEGQTASVQFEIPLSPFRTWWALSLYGLSVLGLFVLIHYVRQRRILRLQKRLQLDLKKCRAQLDEQEQELASRKAQLQDAATQVDELTTELEALQRHESHFKADLSHALRPAVTAITHLGRLIPREKLEKPTLHLVEGIRHASEHLVGALRELLDLRRLDIDHLSVDHSVFDLRDPIEESLEAIAAPALAKGLELNYVIEVGVDSRRHGDAKRLKQILCHLLTNAVAHTPSGEVSVHVRKMQGKSSDYAEFVVIDNGPGLDNQSQVRLLEASNPQKVPRYRGAPQGLAIARHLLQALGGDLTIESTPEEGARIHFHLNLPPEPQPIHPSSNPLAEKLVLIVDDNPTTLKSLQQLAEERGLRTRLANDGPQALEALKELPPADIVWMDDALGDSSGREVLKRMRATDAGSNLPIILLAPHAYDPSLHALGEDPNTAILRKPFHHGPLLAVTRGLLDLFTSSPDRPGDDEDDIANEILEHEEEDEDAAGSEDEDPLEARIRSALANSQNQEAAAAKDRPSPLRILLLDSHPARPLGTVDLLRRIGFDAHIVSSTTAAIEALENIDHDLVLLTAPLPDLSLAEAVAQIRRNLPPGSNPIIAAISPTLGEEDLKSGLQEHLRPPVSPEELRRLLHLIQPPDEAIPVED